MAHTPRHNRQYVIAGTRAPYSGRVIMIAGEPFTTVGGGIEGNNQRLEDSQQNQTTIGFGDDLGLDDFDPNSSGTSNTGRMSRNNGQMRTQTRTSRTRTSGGGNGGGY